MRSGVQAVVWWFQDRSAWWVQIGHGLLWGGFTMLVAGVLGLQDVAHDVRVPRERAQVVAIERSGRLVECPDVDGTVAEHVAVLQVEDPRPGLPATARLPGCPDDHPVGKRITVLRLGPAGAQVEPVAFRSPFQVIGVSALAGGGMAIWVSLFLLLAGPLGDWLARFARG